MLGFTKQAYYAWRAKPVTDRDWDDAHLLNAAIDIHADDPTFGYRFIADELAAQGIAAGENRVARLCRAQRLWSVLAKKPGTGRRPGPAVHDDHVQRDFTATAPNKLWLTDITEHWTSEGKLYLCAVKDVYSGRIIGYSIDSRMKAALAVSALRSAIARRGTTTAVIHSDRGSQGGFKWSSQHSMITGVCDGTTSAASGPGSAAGDALAGKGEAASPGRARLLAIDRRGTLERGRGRDERGLGAGGLALVPPRWRHATTVLDRADRTLSLSR